MIETDIRYSETGAEGPLSDEGTEPVKQESLGHYSWCRQLHTHDSQRLLGEKGHVRSDKSEDLRSFNI